MRLFSFTRLRVYWRDLTSNRGQSHRAADEEASLRTAVREEGASEEQSAEEGTEVVPHISTVTSICMSPCEWPKMGGALGANLGSCFSDRRIELCGRKKAN